MATLVLSVVGTVFGGPVGGAIGAIIGQQVDQNILFKPKGARGPRMQELAVQTSSYGSAIPKIFGTMRVAGTVIWATDLRETRSKQGGKGKPSVTQYSYSVSFAVALSARRISRIGRIWADGNLLRGTGGDFKTQTGFRFYSGTPDQQMDPLIAAVEGMQNTPAYRDVAYAVFEDFQLGDYGNRIPSLSFEVVADDGAVHVAQIIQVLSGGILSGTGGQTVSGYAASGDSVCGAIETLARVMPLSLDEDGTALTLVPENAAAVPISEADLGAGKAGRQSETRRNDKHISPLSVPQALSLAYYEPEREFQAGSQSAARPSVGRRSERIDLPAALNAAQARTMVENGLARSWTARVLRTVQLPWRYLGIRPGQIIRIGGGADIWRVTQWSFEQMMLNLCLVRHSQAVVREAAAEPGRSIQPVDRVHGATRIVILDMPDLSDQPANRPRLYIAAAGVSPGWRSATLAISHDNQTSWTELGRTAPPANMGQVPGILGPGSPHLFDHISVIDVALLHSEMTLENADAGRLLAGANLAMLGKELIQFGRAEPLGAGRYRLSRLLRGRRGTEYAITSHVAEEDFVLIEAETLFIIDAPLSQINQNIVVMASGIGDPNAVLATKRIEGAAIRPVSPVNLVAIPYSIGMYQLRWTRRSRLGWGWADGVDAPMGEENESYHVTVTSDGVIMWQADVAESHCICPATAGNRVSVTQIGAFGRSVPAQIILG